MNKSLFGEVNFEEEINLEEVNTNESGSGEPDTEKQSKGKKDPDVEVTDLETELLEIKELEQQEETEENKGTLSSDDDSSNSSSPEYKPIADLSKVLHEEGFLTYFDEEEFKKIAEESGDPLVALGAMVKNTTVKLHEGWIEQYPKPIQDAMKAYQENLPLEEIFNIKRNEVMLEGITEEKLDESEELRKQVLTKWLEETTKLTSEEIKEQVDDWADLGKDTKKAKEAVNKLKDISKEKEKQVKIAAAEETKRIQKEHSEMLENIKKDINNTQEIIPGVKLSKKEQEDLYKSITTTVHKTSNGESLTDADYAWSKHPLEMRKAFHYYFQIGMFNIDEKTGLVKPDLKKINTVLKTQVSKELRESLNDGRQFRSGVPGAVKDELETNARKNLGSSLQSFVANRK